MISFEGVSKAYRVGGRRNVVLDDLSIVFASGRNLGILGVNGAGKSTLLRLIAGSEMADRGRITRYARVSFPLGFSGTFHGALSARENVAKPARAQRGENVAEPAKCSIGCRSVSALNRCGET